MHIQIRIFLYCPSFFVVLDKKDLSPDGNALKSIYELVGHGKMNQANKQIQSVFHIKMHIQIKISFVVHHSLLF